MESNLSSPRKKHSEPNIASDLRSFAHWGERATAFAAKRLGLHITDLSLIGLLQERPEGASPKDIMQHLGLSSGAATALIDRLVRAGYVERVPNSKDRRSVLIRILPDAAEEPLEFYRARQNFYQEIIATFSEEELAVIRRFLQNITRIEPENILLDVANTKTTIS